MISFPTNHPDIVLSITLLVHDKRLELLRLSAYASKAYVSANSTNHALYVLV